MGLEAERVWVVVGPWVGGPVIEPGGEDPDQRKPRFLTERLPRTRWGWPGAGVLTRLRWQVRTLNLTAAGTELGSQSASAHAPALTPSPTACRPGPSSELAEAPWRSPGGVLWPLSPWGAGAGGADMGGVQDSQLSCPPPHARLPLWPLGAPPAWSILWPPEATGAAHAFPLRTCVFTFLPQTASFSSPAPPASRAFIRACVCFSCVGFEMISLNKV